MRSAITASDAWGVRGEVWSAFGYEGESASKGGYMSRGFDDITWL